MPSSVSVTDLVLEVDLVVAPFAQLLDDLGELVVAVGRLLGLAGDDQRRAGLVDQDVVDLVDDGVVEVALDALLGGGRPCCRAGSRSRTRCWCRR